MRPKFTLLVYVLFLSFSVRAQWTQLGNFPGVPRSRATCFTIGNKIYLMGGYAGQALKDFWEYNIVTSVWTQKANFPGPERYGAVSFSLGNSGYIATGENDFGYLNDLWEYNTVTDIWMQKAALPINGQSNQNKRTEAFAFVIGNKAYVGGGIGFVQAPNSTFSIAFFDLWEYDPATGSWTQRANMPSSTGKNMATAAVLNGKGYVGLGCNATQTANYNSFFEYDPTLDVWTTKANFPTQYTTDAISFAYDTSIYILGGVNLNPVALSNQFYKYDPSTDMWSQLPNFQGGAIAGAISCAVGNAVFVSTGFDANLNLRSDMWRFPQTQPTEISTLNGDNIDITIYPNPAVNTLNIISSEKIKSSEVFDITGKLVIKVNDDDSQLKVNMLHQGLYILKITYGNGSSKCTRFVKK